MLFIEFLPSQDCFLPALRTRARVRRREPGLGWNFIQNSYYRDLPKKVLRDGNLSASQISNFGREVKALTIVCVFRYNMHKLLFEFCPCAGLRIRRLSCSWTLTKIPVKHNVRLNLDYITIYSVPLQLNTDCSACLCVTRFNIVMFVLCVFLLTIDRLLFAIYGKISWSYGWFFGRNNQLSIQCFGGSFSDACCCALQF